MSMMKEFKEFAVKGSVIDLAVGVIIGGAFGKIVESLVQDVIMPVVGKLLGGLDFAAYYLPMNNQGTALSHWLRQKNWAPYWLTGISLRSSSTLRSLLSSFSRWCGLSTGRVTSRHRRQRLRQRNPRKSFCFVK